MKCVDTPTVTYHSVSTVRVGDVRHDTAGLTSYTEIFNDLNCPVTIVARNGVPYTIPPSHRNRNNELIIRVIVELAPHTSIDAQNAFYSQPDHSDEGVIHKQHIDALKQRANHESRKHITEYVVGRDEFVDNGGGLYLAELDMVVSVLVDDRAAVHPFAQVSTRWKLIDAFNNINTDQAFGYNMFIVSNNRDVGDKYVNIAGSVYRVPSVVNHSLSDGAYLCSSGSTTKTTGIPMPVTKRYDMAEAYEKLRLYDDPETAANCGDELKAREEELKLLNIKLKEVEQQHKQELMEKQRILDDEEHRRSMDQLRQKDYYESRSYSRKDDSEGLKVAGVIIGGVLTIATILYKFNPN